MGIRAGTQTCFGLFLILLGSGGLTAGGSQIPSSSVTNLLPEYRREAVWFRDDHPQGQYTRVNSFTCGAGMDAVENTFNRKLSDFYSKRGEFSNFSLSRRRALRDFLPRDWNDLKARAAEESVAGDNAAFLLSVAIRETGADPFKEESTNSRYYKKPGTGLLQMTAINKVVDGKPVDWAFDDYESYEKFFRINPPADTRLPASVSYDGKKDIRTVQDFKESAFNLYASLWYGQEKVEGHKAEQLRHARFRNEGFDFDSSLRFGQANRDAILGTMYNAGCHRMRCAVIRAKVWNEDSRTEKMAMEDWTTLRSFIYLDGSKAQAAGVPADLVSKLKNVCVGKTDSCSEVPGETCSCLDNESTSRPSPLEGYAWRGAIAMSYGDHIKKISACFDQ
ncbi:hypothetical protein GW916_14745 [bacterium]|nr:hypothetical protein [bacterium]